MSDIPVFKGHFKPKPPPEPAQPAVPPGMMMSGPAAEWLKMSERKLSEETSLGRIRCARYGRAVRYDIKDLIAYVEARKSGGSAPIESAPPLLLDAAKGGTQ